MGERKKKGGKEKEEGRKMEKGKEKKKKKKKNFLFSLPRLHSLLISQNYDKIPVKMGRDVDVSV